MNEFDKINKSEHYINISKSGNGASFYSDCRNIISLETRKIVFTLDSTKFHSWDAIQKFNLNKNILTFYLITIDSPETNSRTVKNYLLQYNLDNNREIYRKELGDSIDINFMDFDKDNMYVLNKEKNENYYLKVYSLPNH